MSAHGVVSYELSGEWPEHGKNPRWSVTLFMYVDGRLAISVTCAASNLVEAVDKARAFMAEAQTELTQHGQLLMDMPDAAIRYGDAIIRGR